MLQAIEADVKTHSLPRAAVGATQSHAQFYFLRQPRSTTIDWFNAGHLDLE
jgi:hypothetical protein